MTAECTKCNKTLKPTWDDPEGEATDYQFDNALWVGFFGGYGMFVDDIETEFGVKKPVIEGAAYDAVLCHECAHELCEQNPWINKLLNPLKSHAHTQKFWDENPNHEGWDKKSQQK